MKREKGKEKEKEEKGVFILLDADSTDEEFEDAARALGWTPEMGDAEEEDADGDAGSGQKGATRPLPKNTIYPRRRQN